jgi:hypothetical protein
MSKGAFQAPPPRLLARIFARGSLPERTQLSSARVQNRHHSRPRIGRAWCGRAAPSGPGRCRQPGCTPRGSGRDCEKIEAFYLPSYSPELNPDEFLNANLKHSVTTAPPQGQPKPSPEPQSAAFAASRNNSHASRTTSNMKTYAPPRNNSSGPYQIISTLVSDELACRSKRLLERRQGAFHRLCAEQLRWRYGEITNS